MEDSEKIKQRFELLKMARDLLNEDYINKRAEDHNKWIAENDESWRTKRRNVPYPPFTQYPTDEEIVRAAANLYNFIYLDQPLKEEPIEVKLAEVIERPIPEGDFVFPKQEIKETASKSEIIPEPVPVPVPKVTNMTPMPEPEVVKENPVIEQDQILAALESLKNTIPPSETIPKMLVENSINLENQRKITTMGNLKKMLPGWVRRTENNPEET